MKRPCITGPDECTNERTSPLLVLVGFALQQSSGGPDKLPSQVGPTVTYAGLTWSDLVRGVGGTSRSGLSYKLEVDISGVGLSGLELGWCSSLFLGHTLYWEFWVRRCCV